MIVGGSRLHQLLQLDTITERKIFIVAKKLGLLICKNEEERLKPYKMWILAMSYIVLEKGEQRQKIM